MGSDLSLRKSQKFGALKARGRKGDLWSGRLSKENRVFRRELHLTILKKKKVSPLTEFPREHARNTIPGGSPVT